MSFLNDLKQQAEHVRAGRTLDQAALQQKVDTTQQACQLTFKYWLELARQLNVLKPVSRARYTFDARVVLEQPAFTTFRADIRRKGFLDRDVTDHVALNWDIPTGQDVHLVKNFPADMQRLQARIDQGGVRCDPYLVRNPDTGKLSEVRYGFVADLQAGVKLQPDHERAQVSFVVDNVDGLTRWVVQFDASQVDEPLLDELARWIVGQPHQFPARGTVAQLREA